ncbi:MAG: S1 RNA-binding domain-containing protein [Clostridia bacterium]|nr:S1 RNA-binding domain-containing protein [Clostridia bacterium]
MAQELQIFSGTVEGITAFGAFVALQDGRKGLVHISEIANSYVSSVSDILAVGDEVTVALLGEDDNGRIRLSIKQALPPEPPAMTKQEFENVVSQFMKQSEERQLDLKRNIRKKSGGRSRK